MKCKIPYVHDFPDFPCKKCNGIKWYWLKFKARLIHLTSKH